MYCNGRNVDYCRSFQTCPGGPPALYILYCMMRETHKMCRFENPSIIVLYFSSVSRLSNICKLFLCLSEYSVDSLATCQTAESNSKFVETQTPQSDVLLNILFQIILHSLQPFWDGFPLVLDLLQFVCKSISEVR